MNWSDLLVVGIIAIFGLIGLSNGFIFSIFKLVSFFLSVFLSIKFYPQVAEILKQTQMYVNIKESILKNLLLKQQDLIAGVDGQARQATDTVINNLPLPEFFKETLIRQVEPARLFDVTAAMEAVSTELANVVISVISLILLYILIRIGLVFVRTILRGVAKLPVFKQMDKLGGFAFGAVEGLLTIYIIFAVLMLFNSSPQFEGVFRAVNDSAIARFFYENNFIVDWMFPSKIPV